MHVYITVMSFSISKKAQPSIELNSFGNLILFTYIMKTFLIEFEVCEELSCVSHYHNLVNQYQCITLVTIAYISMSIKVVGRQKVSILDVEVLLLLLG